MDSSIVLAKFIGPFTILIGATLFLNTKYFQHVGGDFFKNSALAYITGLITFVAGLAVVIFHNIWAADWRVLITVYGWLVLIKGAWIVLLPGTLPKMTQVLLKNVRFILIPWAVMIAIGIFLTVKGYS
ncbi:MAG: hypothetical protein JW919_06235 [Candidatus Omnitrophica bacterium]|nr:hypothetical protein [Candidatus Omnitrophota bacterium]